MEKIPYSVYREMVALGLTPVEYIENTGNNAYINTGVKPADIKSLYVDYQATRIPDASENRPMYIAGAGRLVNDDAFTMVFKDARYEDSYVTYDGSRYDYATCNTNRHTLFLDGNKLYYDGSLVRTFPAFQGACKFNIYLFHVNYSDMTLNDRCLIGKIYGAQIRDNDNELVRDYYPCVNGQGKAGMYEAVTKQYVSSVNSDNFSAGDTVEFEYPVLQVMTDGVSFHGLELKKYTVESIVMSLGDKITGDVYYKDNSLAFTMREYVMYEGVKYVLVNPPTIIREGMVSDNSELKGMTKYSLTFYHPMYMLGNFPFTDVAVTNDERQHKSHDKTFSWIGTLFDFIDKLNANLYGTEWVVDHDIEQYKPDGVTETEQWKKAMTLCGEGIKRDDGTTTEKNNVLSFDKNFISDALKTAYDTWEISFTITALEDGHSYGQNKKFLIQFGLPSQEIYALNEQGQQTSTPFVFQFGQGVGLKNNSRTPRNNKIVTRLAGCGSDRNIPYGYPQVRWYGAAAAYTYGDHAGVYTNVSIQGHTFAKIVSYPIYKGVLGGQYVSLIKHPFTRKTLMPSVYSSTLFNKVSYLNPNGTPNTSYNPDIELVDYYDAVDDASHQFPNNINPLAPSFENHEFSSIYPRLGEERLIDVIPWDADGVNILTKSDFLTYVYGLITNTTIEPEKDALLEMISMINDLPYAYGAANRKTWGAYTFSWVCNFKENKYYEVEYTSSGANFKKKFLPSVYSPVWDDSIDDKGNPKQSYFKIKLPRLSFDLYACASITETMEINMRSGACLGCTFEVQVDWDVYKANFFHSDGTFDPVIHVPNSQDGHIRDGELFPDSSQGQIEVIVQKDTETFGTIMPNLYQMVKGESTAGAGDGDEFVILGVSLPTSYISNAEQELDDAMYEYMLENNVYYFDYPLKFDEFFLRNNLGILSQIRNNSIVRFVYSGVNMNLYIKQIVMKFGEQVLPQYDITLSDDIDIVLNKIGQVTDDVSRMRVQVSEMQKYYSENIINEIKSKLSRVSPDIAEEIITFAKGLASLGDVTLSNAIGSLSFESGLYTGHGWRIDQLGNAELESLKVRTFLEVIELIINRMQAQEGDTVFTDNDQIEMVEEHTVNGVTSYILSLKEKYDRYITSQRLGNVIKGVINTLAANYAGVSEYGTSDAGEFYTSWMLAVQTATETDLTRTDNVASLEANQIRVILYGDADTPAGKNFIPCELMTIARWGCTLNPNEPGISDEEKARRRRLRTTFYISTSEGRIAKLVNVSQPMLGLENKGIDTDTGKPYYGFTVGELPQFIKEYTAVSDRLAEGRDYMYAQGIVVQDFIKINMDGSPQVTYVDMGVWSDNTVYLHEEYNSATGQYETHDVWHNNARWRAKMHEPVSVGGTDTYYEPSDSNSAYWQKLEEGVGGDQYMYGISQYATTSNSTTKPADINTWNGVPPTPTDAKPYVWARIQRLSWDATRHMYVVTRTTYVRQTGEQGYSMLSAGTVIAHYSNFTQVAALTGLSTNDKFIIDTSSDYSEQGYSGFSAPSVVEYLNISGRTWRVTKADMGTVYTTSDGHMWQAIDGMWTDMGLFKGDGASFLSAVGSCFVSEGVSSGDTVIKIYNGESYTEIKRNDAAADSNTGNKRGILYVVVNRETLAVVGTPTFFDTYGDASRRSALATIINSNTGANFVILASYDAVGWSSDIENALIACGGRPLNDNTAVGRYPFAFIGYKGLEAGCAQQTEGALQSPTTVGVIAYVADGNMTTSKSGSNGQRGKVGRFFYYGGVFDSTNNTKTFIVSDAQAPYFKHISSGQTMYHVFNPENPTSSSYTMSQMWTESQQSWNNLPWEIMTNDFKYLITEAVFGSFAHFGSAIISGDWMLSQHGTIYDANDGAHVIDDTHSYGIITIDNAYTYFKPAHPADSESGVTNFVPNYCVDLYTGAAFFGGGKIQLNADGSGQLADGSITWDTDGNANFDGKVTASQMYTQPREFVVRHADPLDASTPVKLIIDGDTSGGITMSSRTIDNVTYYDWPSTVYDMGAYVDISAAENTYIEVDNWADSQGKEITIVQIGQANVKLKTSGLFYGVSANGTHFNGNIIKLYTEYPIRLLRGTGNNWYVLFGVFDAG